MRPAAWLAWLAGGASAFAQNGVDEDALFADTVLIVDSASRVNNAAVAEEAREKKTVGLSGNILSMGIIGAERAYLDAPDVERTSLASVAVADVSLDARLLRGFRAFATLEWSAQAAGGRSDSGMADFRAPELFLDANIGHRAYFRVGKQVLQWGRGFFFNPTDLVNVERKTFFRRIGNREGTYGAKVHAPFGTVANLYGFLDVRGVGRPDSLAGAAKAEWLWGRTEMAIMLWDRIGRAPVYGSDVSTRALGLDITAEFALHQAFEVKTLDLSGAIPRIDTTRREWMPRASLGLGRSFTVSGVRDRLTTVAEFYYNRPGSISGRLPFPDPEALGLPPGTPLSPSLVLAALAAAGIYEPNSYSRHYAAFFATFGRFLRSDLTLSFNAIGNLDQGCVLLSTGLVYRDLNDFSLSLSVNAFAGPENTEYTFSRQAVQVQAIGEAAF